LKKWFSIVVSLVLVIVIITSAFIAIKTYKPASTLAVSNKPFYVGTTYSGNSINGAKQLIDNVKNYTNLFVLQSGALMLNFTATEQICDYAVNSGLNIILYYSTNCLGEKLNSFLNEAKPRWGSHYLGIYFNDEPAGHLLDSYYYLLNDDNTDISITKDTDVTISFNNQSEVGLNTISTQYKFGIVSGIIIITTTLSTIVPHGSIPTVTNLTPVIPKIPDQTAYYPNGTITYTTDTTLIYEPNGTVFDENGQVITNQGNISHFEPYQQVWNLNPLLNYTDAANFYVNNLKTTLSSIRNQSNVTLYTSDYGLYWFDYAGGYDTIFSEFGWNNSRQIVVSLCRGAAIAQNKEWGVMITWTYDHKPYLENATQLYNDMKLAYDNGASYVVVACFDPFFDYRLFCVSIR
jgi:hypothetical protein